MRKHWITGLALLAVCAPSLAAGSRMPGARDQAPEAMRRPDRGTPVFDLAVRGGIRPRSGCVPSAASLLDDRALLVHSCGLQTLSTPELAPPAAPPSLPSLRDPAAPLAAPPPLPALPEAVPPSDQEDTLYLLRSHW